MQMPRTFIRLFLRPLLLLIPILLPVAAGSAEQPRYILAVVPNMPAVTLHRSWTPLVDRISRETGVKIELKLYDRITTFIEASDAGIPDFLYSAPNMFYQAYQKQKYIPLLRSSNYFRGRVFVRRDSPYRKVSDLAGRTIAFVGPRNLCSVMTRQAMLAGEGPIDYNARFSGSTVNVAKSVLFGKADAGVTLDVNMTGDFPEMMEEFRTILETEELASHPLAAHPRVPAKVRHAVARSVFAMSASDAGRKLLVDVNLSDPVKTDFKRDYAIYREVDMDRIDRTGHR